MILRYRHDPVGGEQINVGIVVHAARSGFLGAVMRRSYGRISKVFPTLDGASCAMIWQASSGRSTSWRSRMFPATWSISPMLLPERRPARVIGSSVTRAFFVLRLFQPVAGLETGHIDQVGQQIFAILVHPTAERAQQV
ncbi:DUF3037 domain-containing protein [Mesorhizobium waimense]|uniref:DUF3037 domain-containing protein n=1 Tax=Mesorhizobium waimense TaxID=1300307 RepID=A0A3A5KAH2_9HYPH|nr:DUF3037 domain-containing protein [Mesorhizobium waimense]